MELNKKKLRKIFPNLAEEMENKTCETKITSFRSDETVAEKAVSKKFTDYIPDVIDFLRRCEKVEQAEEIICYLEKRKEIIPAYAKKLRKQLKAKGIRSFGPKKDDDYYLNQNGF
jgi:hypothetical protein